MLGTVYLLLSTIQQQEINKPTTVLDNTTFAKVIKKIIKQCRDLIAKYEARNNGPISIKKKNESGGITIQPSVSPKSP